MDSFINKIRRVLELYILDKTEYRLSGDTYDLMLVVPSINTNRPIYSIIISSPILNNINPHEKVENVLRFLQSKLTESDYIKISRVNVLDTTHSFVKNLNFTIPLDRLTTEIEINNITIGGVNIYLGYLLKPLLLGNLKKGEAHSLVLNNREIVNAGIISVSSDCELIYYNGKGLREIWKGTSEETNKLQSLDVETHKKMGYVDSIKLDEIYKII